ncbi:DrmE family protein [Asticcacaulis taihuensis]|uniref:Uncharacterized protein n=1 Tax=Asticcacaulis taihuensis TaxID=260084 RepID=A0A1G4SSE9_9CAUL|nr:DrmE family protein [Asticcacaulis taihuensis]SCW71219.1 hypothetical protein SAMN02927928_2814 [Asticcacaulis taihuensis]
MQHFRSLLPDISRTLELASSLPEFPVYQIGQWVWLASQFRLLAEAADPMATIIGAALNFLGKIVQKGSIGSSEVQDLNWVLASTVTKISPIGASQINRAGLSSGELMAIEARLLRLAGAPFDVTSVRRRVESQIRNLEAFSSSDRLTAVPNKIEALFAATGKADKIGAAARSALLYLADEDDIVPDGSGVLGLVDDVYVIDWAYSVVEGQTQCLPILEALTARWPYVADLAIYGSPKMPLSRFGQYVCVAALYSLFSQNKRTLLVLRDVSAFGTLAAFFGAIECASDEAQTVEQDIASWPINQNVVISDGVKQFKAVFKGVELIGSKKKYRIGVRNNGSITVGSDVAPYIAAASASHKILCDGAELSTWLKERHLDPMATLTGYSRQRVQERKTVLFLGPKSKFFDYFTCIHPFGMTASKLVGVKYVGADGVQQDFDGEPCDAPLIYACSDVSAAIELLTARPKHVSEWKVVIDGATAGRNFLASMEAAANKIQCNICIIGDLRDREAADDLIQGGAAVWYLEDQDVEPAPLSPPDSSGDALTRAVGRQNLHWLRSTRVDEVRSSFLERAADWLSQRNEGSDGGALQPLEFEVSSFIQKATSSPIRDEIFDAEIEASVRRIISHASVLAPYEERASHLFSIFQSWRRETLGEIDKRELLANILHSYQSDQNVAIVCRSDRVARSCQTAFSKDVKFPNVNFMNLEGVRKNAPYDRIIVPGWLDKMGMRELAQTGYSVSVELILFPFEKKWYNTSIKAGNRWERQLEKKTISNFRSNPVFSQIINSKGGIWQKQVVDRLNSSDTSVDYNAVEFGTLEFEDYEAEAIALLEKSISQEQEKSNLSIGKLVLFERDSSYTFLPPHGKVIVLADNDRQLSDQTSASAESRLFRLVSSLQPGMVLAFPQGGDRDLVDSRADEFIKNASSVRVQASSWKTALKRHFARTNESYSAFSRRLANSGEPRDPQTVKAWANNTHSVAPKNYKTLIPLLALLTDDDDLKGGISATVRAIDLIYKARSLAAESIVHSLLSGEIDTEAEELTFQLNGRSVGYALHKIKSLGLARPVQTERLGVVQYLIRPHVARGEAFRGLRN